MHIRPATPDDIPEMREIAASAATAGQWTAEQYARIFTPDPPRLVLVIEEDVVQGFLVAAAGGPDWEIENLAVAGPARRRGLGAALVAHLLGTVRRLGAESVFLEVKRVLAPGGIFLFAEEPVRRLLTLRLYRSPYRNLMKPWERKLYDWGRHHPSLVLMPDGQIVMTYVVRKGYLNTSEGFPRFGIEAVVSRDHGRTWDLDHKYILHQWSGHIKDGPTAWYPSSQATSTATR